MDNVMWAAFVVVGAGCASSLATANLASEGQVPAVEGLPGETQTVGSLLEVAEKEGVREVERRALLGGNLEGLDVGRASKTGDEIEECNPLQVYFRAGSAELDSVAENALRRLPTCMTRYDEVTVEVMGHSGVDQSSPLEGPLRAARVDAVIDYLEAREVPEERYSVRHGIDF